MKGSSRAPVSEHAARMDAKEEGVRTALLEVTDLHASYGGVRALRGVSLTVREGEIVERGRIVGLVGATGRVTGPHLHWALRVEGARVDALSALALLGAACSGC